jgi:serine/threonine-protein kinase SRPK3
MHQLSITKALSNYNVLPPDDIPPAAEFIAACLHLDPSQRPSARDLIRHPWVIGAKYCRDYRKPMVNHRSQQ